MLGLVAVAVADIALELLVMAAQAEAVEAELYQELLGQVAQDITQVRQVQLAMVALAAQAVLTQAVAAVQDRMLEITAVQAVQALLLFVTPAHLLMQQA